MTGIVRPTSPIPDNQSLCPDCVCNANCSYNVALLVLVIVFGVLLLIALLALAFLAWTLRRHRKPRRCGGCGHPFEHCTCPAENGFVAQIEQESSGGGFVGQQERSGGRFVGQQESRGGGGSEQMQQILQGPAS